MEKLHDELNKLKENVRINRELTEKQNLLRNEAAEHLRIFKAAITDILVRNDNPNQKKMYSLRPLGNDMFEIKDHTTGNITII